MSAPLRTSAAPSVTGRSYARRMASLTGGSRQVSAGRWVAEARGAERRRRAVACRLGRLTGTAAPRWSGEIGDQEWQTVLAAGAQALTELFEDGRPGVSPELADTARGFAAEASGRNADGVIDRTRNGRSEALVDDLLAAQPASPLDIVGNDERKGIQEWSPFRGGPRHVVRCADGTRRYGDGSLAAQH
ncbi:hypothetical protein [Kitasatospora viridis]|uniref:Uncharacterized protein n=1 Tax=Kitasatospora viridis TaxID=281105 RepID=A0A561UDU2_9ACTN|nr:hypothetical protein [Kitasatospora viridis]TWF97527.1 hypothetical protein FHX73_111308 [Kitasatospora viridis]